MGTQDVLARSELFGHLSQRHLRKLADRSRSFSYEAGETVFKEGDEATEVYVVAAGRVALEIEIRPVPDRSPVSTTVEIATENESFGWSGLVEPRLYTASARCVTPCSLVALRGDMLRGMMDDDPELGHQVMSKLVQVISSRLAHTRMRLTTGLGLILRDEEPHLSRVSG